MRTQQFTHRHVGRLCIRWRRSTSCVLRNARTLDAADIETPLPRYLFTVDAGIGRYYNTFVFAAGAYPHWALMETNELRVHPMNLEVDAHFCEFSTPIQIVHT